MTFRAAACLLVAGLVVTACASAAPSATPRPIDFRGTVTDAVSGFEADGFACEVNTLASNRPSLPPGYPSAFYALFTATCRRDAAPGPQDIQNIQGKQGTFVTLYGQLSDGSLVGIDIMSDQLGSDPPSSPLVSSALARVFAPVDVAAVETAIRNLGKGGPPGMTVSDRVQVYTETSPLLFSIRVWGPAVTALHDAIVAGPSRSP